LSRALHVLIVDDDPHMADTLADILDMSGYQIRAVHSAAEALKSIRANPPDCIITDVRMPGMSGFELHAEIRKLGLDIPVVLMTAYAADEAIEDGLNAGVIGVLTKPLDIQALLDFLVFLGKEFRILVVDDDPAFGSSLIEILKSKGYPASQVFKVNEVLDALTSHTRTILLDLKLDGENGFEVIPLVRKSYPGLPVVMVTGYRSEMALLIENALEQTAFACLEKPLDILKLMGMLEKIRAMGLKNALKGGRL